MAELTYFYYLVFHILFIETKHRNVLLEVVPVPKTTEESKPAIRRGSDYQGFDEDYNYYEGDVRIFQKYCRKLIFGIKENLY